jgi:hypothetical protein
VTTKDNGITFPSYSYVGLGGGGVVITDTVNDYTVTNAWKFYPGLISPINLTNPSLTVPAALVIKGQNANALFAAVGGNIYLTPGTGTLGNGSGNVVINDNAGNGAAWNTTHIVMGGYSIWFDALDRMRTKAGTPTGDTDGNVVGCKRTFTKVYDPASIANGAQVSTTIAAAGASLGDFVQASFSLSLAGVTLSAYVDSANSITVIFSNTSGGAVDLGSGTISVRAATP